jgi:hypothetical protein
MNEAICDISAVPMPCVVVAAVPTRIPLVTAGVSGSYGIEFLFRTIPDAPHLSSATLPFTPVDLISISLMLTSINYYFLILMLLFETRD